MPIRLKFKAVSLTDAGGGSGKTVNLTPVMEAAENQEHYRAQSGHMITIGTLHNKSADTFEAGKEYWMDFTPVEGSQPDEVQPQDQHQAAQQSQADRQREHDEEEAVASRSARQTAAAKQASKAETPSHSTHKPQAHSKHATLTHDKSKASVRR